MSDKKIAETSGAKDDSSSPLADVTFNVGNEEEEPAKETPASTTDAQSTPDLFCELEELRYDKDKVEWKETARWIRFEEDVEEEGNRWSKPHVASLSMHQLTELRKLMLTGSVMLELEADNLADISNHVAEDSMKKGVATEDQCFRMKDILQRRHRHQHERPAPENQNRLIRTLSDIGRNMSADLLHPKASLKKRSSNNLMSMSMSPSGSNQGSTDALKLQNNNNLESEEPTDTKLESKPSSKSLRSHFKDRNKQKYNEHFAKKIPSGAETANIMVGKVDFLSEPIMAFIKLAKPSLLGDLTEVPVPTRFIFILLGPEGNFQYHEVGRCIATLLSEEIFHRAAYKAKNRQDIIDALDLFIDQVTVLPPGEWDPNIRIDPPSSVPKQEEVRKRAAAANQSPPDGQNGTVVALPEPEEEVEEEDEALKRTGRLFGGLIMDLKRKAPFYLSDFKDAFHPQVLASWWFMYFAILSPIVTFGGLLGSATHNNIAAMECLLSGAIAGITFHLFSGQPLTIISSTGPMLVFETIVYNICHDFELNYLAFRFWVGIWVTVCLLFIVAFDLSALVRHITRFTEESFASLIACIFVFESFKKLYYIYEEYPVNTDYSQELNYSCLCVPAGWNVSDFDAKADSMSPEERVNAVNQSIYESGTDLDGEKLTFNLSHVDFRDVNADDCLMFGGSRHGAGCDTPHYVPDVFFFSCLLFIFTFTMANALKMFRNASCFPNRVRTLVSDFAVIISIICMVVLDLLVGLDTPKLQVPSSFRPTRDDRGWIVNPFNNPYWTIPASIIPALLATILIFMDQQITAVIVNRKENLLKKGKGYHLDILILSVLIAICSLLGIPWFVAATVESMNHVKSLSMETETAAPGEKPKFLGVREQRLTGICTFILVGLSSLATEALKHIPMPVLYGVFLYMGVTALRGLQFMDRVAIIFMPTKYQPDYTFLRKVRISRVHLYTFFQALCLVALWVIKSNKTISIAFPLMVLLLCFIRKLLDYVFTQNELRWLDDATPQTKLQEKEEKKKAKKKNQKVIKMKGGAVSIPLKDGRTLSVPADSITYDPSSNQISLGTEIAKSMLMHQLMHSDSSPRLIPTSLQAGINEEDEEDDSKLPLLEGDANANHANGKQTSAV